MLKNPAVYKNHFILWTLILLLVSGCSNAYYSAMEKVGVHKRDILVDRVEGARDSQEEAQEQFKSALEQFESVVKMKDSDLKKAYDRMHQEYDQSNATAREVSARIDKVEAVANALFDEWQQELELYKNEELRRSSKQQLNDTKIRYHQMLATMHKAERSMQPVLQTFQDNVLFLKHNLNAQAIGSLRSEFSALQGQIDQLITKMNAAIESSNTFIAEMK